MHNDFDKIETELRQIEEDFETGRMNAFGSKASQDAFIRELRRIADIESQVFYKTCTILKASNRGEHAVITNMFANAEASGQGGSTGMTGGEAGMEGSARFRSRSTADYSATSSPSPVPNGMSSLPLLRRGSVGVQGNVGLPRPLGKLADGNVANSFYPGQSSAGRRGSGPSSDPSATMEGGADEGYSANGASFSNNNTGSMAGTSGGAETLNGAGGEGFLRTDVWGNEAGYADTAFDDVVGHFQLLESEFEFVGEHLRQISKHVMRLNDMSDQVNSTNPSNTAELSALRREASRAKKRTVDDDASMTRGSMTNRSAPNNNY